MEVVFLKVVSQRLERFKYHPHDIEDAERHARLLKANHCVHTKTTGHFMSDEGPFGATVHFTVTESNELAVPIGTEIVAVLITMEEYKANLSRFRDFE